MKRTKNCREAWHRATFKIVNATGLHARAAAAFVKVAKQFPAEVEVCKEKVCVNGKSMLGILMLGAQEGQTIVIKAKGLQFQEVLDQLGQLIHAKFYE